MPHPLASGLTYVYPLCGLVFIMITLKLASIQQNKAQDVFCLFVYTLSLDVGVIPPQMLGFAFHDVVTALLD